MESTWAIGKSNILPSFTINRECFCRITCLFLTIIALSGCTLIALGICQFHLPYWSSYIGCSVLFIDSILFALTFASKRDQFVIDENVIGNDPLTIEKFCEIIPKYSLHKSNYTHIIFAAFNRSQAHNLFDDREGVVSHAYGTILETWPKGSILIVICARDSVASEELFKDPLWIPHILTETTESHLNIYNKSDWIGLDDHEVSLLNGGRLPNKLRRTLFGNIGGTLSYLV